MSSNKEWVAGYINETRFVALATVDESGAPELRSLGSFGADGHTVYFSTGAGTAKVSQIAHNDRVTLLFQHEGQELGGFVNLTVTGRAERLASDEELRTAVQVITGHSAAYSERVEKAGLSSFAIYRVDPEKGKILDFGKGKGPDAVTVLTDFE